MSKWLTTGLSVICATALIYAYVFYQPQTEDNTIVLSTVEDCQVNQTTCSVLIDGQYPVTFTMKPYDAKPMTPVSLEVAGEQVDTATITIDGINMNMPGFPIQLKENNHHFQAETSLGFCTQGEMQWQANLNVNIAGNHYLIPFKFTTTS